MIRSTTFTAALFAALATIASTAHATLPFAEDFNLGDANWRFSTATALSTIGSGGPDSSAYVSRTFAFSTLSNPAATSAIVFRAQDEFNSSGRMSPIFTPN